ncbi:MAG: DUF3352 domain-containing protein [Candidatus Omnitrophica bacterium]|nr:DUF3352 domain-containing protein [Candidatus Omnitrophota bacterium]MDD5546466.1 DUF3352 domain-containing protein [Candidatus Omnitrophota bacterium]
MKKPVIIAYVLALVLAAVIIYQLTAAKLPVDNVLPSGAIAYIRITDVEKQINEFKGTRLWKNIKNIDIGKLMEKSGASKKDMEEYQDARKWLSSAFGGQAINEFFGKEMVLAVYPGNIKEIGPGAIQDAASNAVLVTRTRPEADFIEFVSKLINRSEKKVALSEETYKGRKITIVKINDNTDLAYTNIKDLLIIGAGKKAAASCIDVVNKDRPSLSQDKDYISTMLKLSKNASVAVYGNIGSLVSHVKQPAAANEQISKMLGLYSGFKTMGYAYFAGNKKLEAVFFYDRAKMIPLYAKLYSLAPRKDETVKFAPENAISYQWGTFDFKSYWEYISSEMERQSAQAGQPDKAFPLKGLVSGLEAKIGMSLDNDLIPALGDEAAFILMDINVEGLLPMMEFVACFKVKNKATIEKALDSLLKDGEISLQSEGYKGVDLKYINLPFGTDLQPSYCYMGDYLLVSLGRKPIKASIDTSKGDLKSLLENEDFKAVNHGLTGECNSVYFLKADVLMLRAKSICEWLYGWMVIAEKQAEKYKEMAKAKSGALASDIAEGEADLEKSAAILQALEKEIEGLKAQGADTAAKQAESDNLKEDIALKRNMLDEDKKNLEQMRASAERKPSQKMDLPLVKLYLDELVYPVMDGLQSVKAVGSRATFGNDVTCSETFSKVVD